MMMPYSNLLTTLLWAGLKYLYFRITGRKESLRGDNVSLIYYIFTVFSVWISLEFLSDILAISSVLFITFVFALDLISGYLTDRNVRGTASDLSREFIRSTVYFVLLFGIISVMALVFGSSLLIRENLPFL